MTLKKEDASDVAREVTLREIALRAEEDQDHLLETREEAVNREEDKRAEVTHQPAAEEESMTREEEEEATAAEVAEERAILGKEEEQIQREEVQADNHRQMLEMINKVNNNTNSQ